MPVCGNYLFFELPKKIVLNPKDGAFSYQRIDLHLVFVSLSSEFPREST